MVLVRPCPDPKFGDYQTNALMSLAKARKLNPRQLATDVLAKLDVAAWCEQVEIAGAGFLNFRLKNSALAADLEVRRARRTSVLRDKTDQPADRRCLISVRRTWPSRCTWATFAPRSSETAWRARLRLLGHRVITDNHIGDWGTQFGKLLVGWKTASGRRRAPGRSDRRNGAALQDDQRRRADAMQRCWKTRGRNW